MKKSKGRKCITISVPSGVLPEIDDASLKLLGSRKRSTYLLRLHQMHINKYPSDNDNRNWGRENMQRLINSKLESILYACDLLTAKGIVAEEKELYEEVASLKELLLKISR